MAEFYDDKPRTKGGAFYLSSTQLDYDAKIDELRRDLRKAKIGLAQWLVVEVIFDYGFALGRAEAWIPSLEVFALQTGMGKKEIGKAIAKLESYGVLEWDSAPQPDFAEARSYKLFPQSAQIWRIAPRVEDMRLQERAAKTDRWLRALNRAGGPAQGDFFPPKWDHADTLAEVQASSQNGPCPMPPGGTMSPDRAPAPPQVAEPSPFAGTEPPPFRPSQTGMRGVSARKPTVGKNPTRGEKPHASLNGGIELNESSLSFNPVTDIECGDTVGKNPTPSELDADRPEDWPPREMENSLMRQIGDLISAFYAPDVAQAMMAQFGGLWRWRIRQYPFAVEYAIQRARGEWREIHKLGGFLTKHWKFAWKQRAETRRRLLDGNAAEPTETTNSTHPVT